MPTTIPDDPTNASVFLRRAFIACVLSLAVFQFSENTADPDLWGHVLYGAKLLQTGQLMRTEPYSWTAPGAAWINHETLAEAALALAFRLGGGTGLLLLKMAVGLACFGLALAMAARRMEKNWRALAWAMGALAVVEISFGFAARPQIFTALALVGELWLLRKIHDGKMVWALAFPVLFALWINTHGGVVAGLALLVGAAAASTAHGWLAKFLPGLIPSRLMEKPSQNIIVTLWLSAAGAAVALLANPYGFALLRWLINSVLWLRPEIAEWNQTAFDWDHAAFYFCAVLALVAWGFSRRPRAAWELTAILLLAALAFVSIRNTPLFCLAALALVPPHLADVLEQLEHYFQRLARLGRRAAGQRILGGAFAAAAAFILAGTFLLHKERAWTMEVPRDQYPVSALQFVQQHEVRGNLLAFFDWGEMCLWELSDSRVSFDGRLDTCYPAKVIAAHWKFYNAETFGSEALDLNRADFAVLPSNLVGALTLTRKYGWLAAYCDDHFVVLVKNPERFPKLARLKLPLKGEANATTGRAAFPNHLPER